MTETHTTPLVVADWTIDPEAVVAACRMQLSEGAAVHVVVPAWLHGLDWVGDPYASVPCARRQLERTSRLCLAAGLRVESATIGDPDPVTAILDAVAAAPVDRVLLVGAGRHVSRIHPLSVARRAERLTGVPVQSIAAARAPRAPRLRRPFPAGRCDSLRAPRAA